MQPTRRLLGLLAGWGVLGVPVIFDKAWLTLWLLAPVVLGVMTLLEALALLATPSPRLKRTIPAAWPLSVWQPVELTVACTGKLPVRLEVFDHLTPDMEGEGMPAALDLRPGQKLRVQYRARSLVRGERTLDIVELRLPGRLGLLQQTRRISVSSPFRVYPNFSEVARYALLATDNRLSQLGIRLRPRRGEGLEFHQLREYREGDSLRQVDWKATSRLRKLISREYQDERDQQVLLLLDTGFRMRAQDGSLSHFDQTLNALLLLAHAVSRQGDAVGLMTFAGSDRYLAPAKGGHVVKEIMNRVFDLEPTDSTPDFLRAVQDLGKRLRKRSLIVILTNVRDEDGPDLLEACRVLGRRHLVLLATLREQVFTDLHEQPPASVDDAFTRAAAEDYLALRERQLSGLRHAGVLVLDTEPRRLAVGLVNRYLEVKRSGRL
ncbi:uncharacterized protein (DUF58 family) [Fluviicoccus keumensis]|uniref:Uncharacterized protein (DUF58 family) n=1 Tax=Fluviicoccus keumensis TaxID=1435465 RepID=A0A4Q7Z539_9GAMM|nr:DUF58 domain-containing protein [Fluviicoccus keumensis]RZU45124.1 uncharacterized protein (DUF58 family) [Fluviicoccus keumensis]